MQIIQDMKLLREMAKAGHIVLHEDTGKKVRHWTGQMVTAYYIDGVMTNSSWKFRFRHLTIRGKGVDYAIKYFDGCFCPFVVMLDGDLGPAFV